MPMHLRYCQDHQSGCIPRIYTLNRWWFEQCLIINMEGTVHCIRSWCRRYINFNSPSKSCYRCWRLQAYWRDIMMLIRGLNSCRWQGRHSWQLLGNYRYSLCKASSSSIGQHISVYEASRLLKSHWGPSTMVHIYLHMSCDVWLMKRPSEKKVELALQWRLPRLSDWRGESWIKGDKMQPLQSGM